MFFMVMEILFFQIVSEFCGIYNGCGISVNERVYGYYICDLLVKLICQTFSVYLTIFCRGMFCLS